MVKICVREGSDKITAGKLYVAVVQAVLLCGLGTWVMIPQLEKSLAGFHHRAVRWMADMDLNAN